MHSDWWKAGALQQPLILFGVCSRERHSRIRRRRGKVNKAKEQLQGEAAG